VSVTVDVDVLGERFYRRTGVLKVVAVDDVPRTLRHLSTGRIPTQFVRERVSVDIGVDEHLVLLSIEPLCDVDRIEAVTVIDRPVVRETVLRPPLEVTCLDKLERLTRRVRVDVLDEHPMVRRHLEVNAAIR
jgi:hypothetical protein